MKPMAPTSIESSDPPCRQRWGRRIGAWRACPALELTDFYQVDMLGVRYKFITLEAERKPGLPILQRTQREKEVEIGWVGNESMNKYLRNKSMMSGRGTAREEYAQEPPTQSHLSPSILVYTE